MREAIVRYLKGQLTDAKRKELIDWINASEENRKYFEEVEEAWYAAAITHKEAFDEDKAWRKLRKHTHHFKEKKRSLHNFFKYAAFIVIFLGLGWGGHLLFTNLQKEASVSYMELSVPQGETANLQFADQTKVQLNAGSSIRFPEHFKKDKRQVHLNGEAYFQVDENAKRPFVVHAGGLDIRVCGTAFNVKSYPDEDVVETTLEEGKVKVSQKASNGKTARGRILGKGQHLSYDRSTTKFELKTGVDTELYTSWTKGHYKFHGIQLNRLVKSIERLYDVKIEFEHEDLKTLTYTGSFYRDEAVDNILKRVEMSSPIVKIKQLSNKQFVLTHKNQ